MKKEVVVVESEVQMRATASLNKSVADDLKKKDRDMEEVLNEDTGGNDRATGNGHNNKCHTKTE